MSTNTAWQWRPCLPHLTTLVLEARQVHLDLDGVPALQQLSLDEEVHYTVAATVAASTLLSTLTALRFNGRELSFPWQQACALEELALLGYSYAEFLSVLGANHLAAQTGLRSLTVMLPLSELPTSSAWLGSVTALETHFTAHGRQDGINQVGGLRDSPQRACMHLEFGCYICPPRLWLVHCSRQVSRAALPAGSGSHHCRSQAG